ncbi:hypothetical protein ACHAWO_001652 [Cyclotella atomus]|uniref:Trichohyalin-plectin-homology domain-containing protein n=1 Tax=Cyclotella atomus TaxID=382360 RepID=A0ABD3PZW7_9STRA
MSNDYLQDDMDVSIDSIKAGAAVFGNLVFGSEYPEHSLCYSPSPVPNRRKQPSDFEENHHGVALFDTSPPTQNQKENEPVESVSKAATVKRGTKPSRGSSDSKNSFNRPASKKGLKPSSLANTSLPIDLPQPTSINPTINSVRIAKEESIREKLIEVATIKEQRRLEIEEHKALNAEAERTRREVLTLRKQLNERFARAKIERQNRAKADQLAKVENEIQFKSRVHVEHKQTLKEIEDARRRMSTDAKARMRQNNKEGVERMRLAAIAEDAALYEERYESSVATRNTKAMNAQKRRESFAFRNGDARRIRELHAKMEEKRRENEHESFELKWGGERDADEYKMQIARERRESLAGRNDEGRRIRGVEFQMKTEEFERQHESFELKWGGERDAEAYRQQLAKERRESLAFRNAEGHRIRNEEQALKTDEWTREHESYELKWAGERDAYSYQQQMAKERRESLAGRNAHGHRIRQLEFMMKADESELERESYQLKAAGERDADEYKQQMAKERRESLAFRNAEGRRIRDLETMMKGDEWEREHESYELKWAGERDADAYKKQMAKERRESLAFRNAESAKHDAVMKELRQLAQEKDHESYMLKWAGENDAKQYVKEQQELRRQSLEFRNAEGRRHREIEENMRASRQRENELNEEIAAACQQDVKKYIAECVAKERSSLELKGKEHFANRVRAENERQEKLDQKHESFLLETEAWQDVNDYVEECKRRRRLSLAFRAKEKRQHFEYAKQQAKLKVQRQHQDTHFRSEDAKYVEIARLREKARIAIESFNRSPNCSFGG